jgi:hypothetical protein
MITAQKNVDSTLTNFHTAITWMLMLYVLLGIHCAEVHTAFTFYTEDVAGSPPMKPHGIITCNTNIKPQANENPRAHTTYFSICGDQSSQLVLTGWRPTRLLPNSGSDNADTDDS